MGTKVMEKSLIGIILAMLCVVFAVASPMQASASRGVDRDSFREQLKQEINDRFCDRLQRLSGKLPVQSAFFKKCDQTPPPPPEVSVDISADPGTITEGDSSTLSWSSDNADSCTASNGWSGDKATDGDQTVSPTETTTYTITCEGDGGSDSDSVTVTVNEGEPDAPTVDITADPTTITEGASSTLMWNSENADSCTASNGWSGSKAVDGSQSVAPSVTTTYAIECEGDGGTASDSVTVTVNAPEEETGTLIVRKVVIRDDGSDAATTTFSFEVNDEASISFDSDGEVQLERPVGTYTIVEDAVSGFTTEYDNCTDVALADGETETCTITNDDVADEPDAPTVEISASRTTVTEGSAGEATTTLTWESTNADSCTASNAWSGSKAVDGSETVTPTADSTYAIECVGAGGTTTDSVNVDFVPEDVPVGTLVISEVLYNPSAEQGTEAANEWIEIFNGTAGTLDLSGYFLDDTEEEFIFPQGTSLASGSFLLVTGSSTTAGEWTIPGNASWLVLSGFGGGTGQLANTNDSVELFNTASSSVDAVCWGTGDEAFDCDASDEEDGESIGRIDKFVDTGTAADWQFQTPNPGE